MRILTQECWAPTLLYTVQVFPLELKVQTRLLSVIGPCFLTWFPWSSQTRNTKKQLVWDFQVFGKMSNRIFFLKEHHQGRDTSVINLPGNCQMLEQEYYHQIPSSYPMVHLQLPLILLTRDTRCKEPREPNNVD